MKLVDAHCHLDQLASDTKLEDVLNRARENGVCHMLSAGITIEGFPQILEIAKSNDDVSCAVGVQPSEQDCHEPSVEELVTLASNTQVIGIGETGLDYYYSKGDVEWQRERFRRHIRAAKEIKKPLIIHMRESRDDILKILKEEGADEVGGMMHCFSENFEIAKKIMDLNFYISFSGIVTFPKSIDMKEVAKKIPPDRILIETDSPYLAPVPKRGKSNEPSYVKYTAECIANIRGIELEDFATLVTKNFFDLFKFVV